jgi:broad specificity phosphatase PhoE
LKSMWVMRHAERQDEVEEGWGAVSERPFDPPLSRGGRSQAFEAGKALAGSLLQSLLPNQQVVLLVQTCLLF